MVDTAGMSSCEYVHLKQSVALTPPVPAQHHCVMRCLAINAESCSVTLADLHYTASLPSLECSHDHAELSKFHWLISGLLQASICVTTYGVCTSHKFGTL